MNKEEIDKAILTLEVLIDCNKEDGTYYNAQKEWEALEIFKKLQAKVNQLETNRDEAIEYIKSNPNVFYGEYLIDVETLLENECTDEIAGEIRFISTLLSILERGKE